MRGVRLGFPPAHERGCLAAILNPSIERLRRASGLETGRPVADRDRGQLRTVQVGHFRLQGPGVRGAKLFRRLLLDGFGLLSRRRAGGFALRPWPLRPMPLPLPRPVACELPPRRSFPPGRFPRPCASPGSIAAFSRSPRRSPAPDRARPAFQPDDRALHLPPPGGAPRRETGAAPPHRRNGPDRTVAARRRTATLAYRRYSRRKSAAADLMSANPRSASRSA